MDKIDQRKTAAPTAPADAASAASAATAALAAALARPATAGHFDELRGSSDTPESPPLPQWSRFFAELGEGGLQDLDRRSLQVERQIRDNGVTYNVYADTDGPQRPWSVDLFPLIIPPPTWRVIESGVLQRVGLLERIMADVYGPQTLLAQNLLPPALIQGHPGYLRAMHGVAPAGGTHLHIAAFDLARDPRGHWWIVAERTQAPSGLGYLLENRLTVSRQFPQAFAGLRVQRLASTYRALLEGLRAACPGGGDPRIVLLTPGPYNETYFEHAYLARYLGLTLVEGSDLTVRDEHLYLKTLRGLEPVHGVLKRLDDEFLDPLELRADSHLGVPGLLQAVRAGHVLVANAPGSGFLESPALQGFLPALSKHLLGESLRLPSLASWWCGERAAMNDVLPQLDAGVIKSTYPGGAAVLGNSLSRRAADEWAGRIMRRGDDWTVQAFVPLSQMPTWRPAGPAQPGRIEPRSLLLRVFAVASGPGTWRVLPGGLTRIAAPGQDIASMQRGGSSADTWVMTEGAVDTATLLRSDTASADGRQQARATTSRAGENLFWLGRYTERTENTARLARLVLERLNGEEQASPALLAWLGDMASSHGLVLPAVPGPAQARRVFERSVVASLADTGTGRSVGFNLAALRGAASAVRERLSQEQWNVIVRAEQDFLQGCAACVRGNDFASLEATRVLETLSGATAAMTGAQTDRMTRDDGWRLLSTGRNLERLAFLASSLALGLESGSLADEDGFEAMLALFDSTITFHARFQQRRDLPALLDLLVLDRDNPRSLGWVAQTLRGRLAKLEGSAPGEVPDVAQAVPDPGAWSLRPLCERDADGGLPALSALLQSCTQAAFHLSDQLGARYFTHSADPGQSVGA